MIRANNLNKTFARKGAGAERIIAVSDVSFRAENGKITGLLGPNGVGKSTTLRMLVGILEPEKGEAKVDGWDIRKDKYKVRECVGYMPHNSGIYPRLTARENIQYYAVLSGLEKSLASKRINDLVRLLDMQDFADRRCEGFSQGQRTKVALGRALVHEPKTLILDEPTNGLDVMATRKLRSILRRLRDEGHCILVSSHVMQEVSLLCDHVAIINDGRIVVENSVENILQETGQTNFEDAFVLSIGESLEEVG